MSSNFKDDEPCNEYLGNVCTGFGDSDPKCWFCGWDMYEHSYKALGMTNED